MTPYHEFYSDLDLIIESVEQLSQKCFDFWVESKPFYAEENSEYWYKLKERLDEIQNQLLDKPFFD